MKLLSSLKSRFVMVALAGFALAPCAAGTFLAASAGGLPPKPGPTLQSPHDQMRMLFENQILWTRMIEMGVFDNLKAKDAYKDRCLDNYDAFEIALKPYYPDGAIEFGELLEDHINLTEKVFEELKLGNSFYSVHKDWYANAEAIAAFMTYLNPKHWPDKETRLLWRMYLDATLDGALAHERGDWVGVVASYDALHLHALKMADFMSKGMTPRLSPTPTPTLN